MQRRAPAPQLSRSHRHPRSVAAVAFAAGLACMLPCSEASAQGTPGRFPSPRASREVESWLADAGVPEERREAAFEIHARYLGEVVRVRDGEIETWIRGLRPYLRSFDPDSAKAEIAEAVSRIDQQRRLIARLDALEEQLWNEIGAAAGLAPEAAAGLRERGRLARLAGFEGMRTFMQAKPADLATLLAAAKVPPADAVRIRQALAGHDSALAKLLEEQRDLALAAERLRAESQFGRAQDWAETQRLAQQEMADAAAENREPQVAAIYEAHRQVVQAGEEGQRATNRLMASMIRLQLAAVRAIEPIVGDASRLAPVLVAAGIGIDGSEAFFERFEEMGRKGELSASQLSAIAEIRQRSVAEDLPQRLELAELHARRLELPNHGWTVQADGSMGPSPEAEEIAARERALQEGDSQQREMQLVLELGRVVGSKRFGEAMRAWGREQGVPEPLVEQIVNQLVAGIEGGALDAEEMQRNMMRSWWSAPPAWRVIDGEMLEEILEDLAVATATRVVAQQLLADGAPRFEAAIAETSAEMAPPEDLDPSSIGMAFLMGPDPSRLAAIDRGLRRVLEADRAFFDDLVGLLGDEQADAIAPWRAIRRGRLIAASDTMHAMSGEFEFGGLDPSASDFHRLDLFPIALRAVPEAMRDAAVRAAFAAQAERSAQLQMDRWSAHRTLLPERRELWERQGTPTTAEQQIEAHRRIAEIQAELSRRQGLLRDSVRNEIPRLQAMLDPESARAFRRAVLLEMWGSSLGKMPGGEAIETLRDRAEAAGDTARLAAIDAVAARYDAGLDASLDLLWKTSEELRAISPADPNDPSLRAVDTGAIWTSALERAKFRQAEVEFATARALRGL